MTITTPHVLVVDDDVAIRDMYAYKLKLENFTVQIASDGQQGLDAAKARKPDLILLDLRMPVMDGLTMLQKLREEEWGRDIKVLILTNISRSEAPKELQFLRVSRYIVKAHMTPSQVMDVITEVL